MVGITFCFDALALPEQLLICEANKSPQLQRQCGYEVMCDWVTHYQICFQSGTKPKVIVGLESVFHSLCVTAPKIERRRERGRERGRERERDALCVCVCVWGQGTT